MTRLLPWSLLLLLMLAVRAVAQPAFTPAETDAIREAVFRRQFKHNGSMLQGKAQVYFLSIGASKDPSDAFLQRFKEHTPPIKKVSGSEIKAPEGEQEPPWMSGVWVRDKRTGKPGVIFQIWRVRRTGRHYAQVTGGYFEGVLSASSNTYLLVRRRGQWIVLQDRLDTIS